MTLLNRLCGDEPDGFLEGGLGLLLNRLCGDELPQAKPGGVSRASQSPVRR